MHRERIDWEDLQPLPRRKRQDGATREDLVKRKFNIGKAKHRGRNHLSNQKRRAIAKTIADKKAKSHEVSLGKYRSHKRQVAAYWRGEIDEHP